jgi:hypothetical protein
MLGLVLAATAACQAPQDTATLDAPAYVNAEYGVSLPRPFDDWVFEPGTAERTTTVIFHPRDVPLGAQLWGALVLTRFSGPIAVDRVAEQRVPGTWRHLLGPHLKVLGRDSLTLAGRPAVRVRMTGAIDRVGVEVDEYLVARDSDLVLLQFRYPRRLPRDSLEIGYERVVQGLTVTMGAPRSIGPVITPSFGDSLATSRVVPRSPWQPAAYDAFVRYDSAAARADFSVRVDLVNEGADSEDSVASWLWPGFALDSVRAGPSALALRRVGSVSWVRLPVSSEPGRRAVVSYYYHLQPGAAWLPSAMMGMSPGGFYAAAQWLPLTQPVQDSAGLLAASTRPSLTLRFDLPKDWRAVAQGRLVSDATFHGRRRMTWRTDEVATSAAAFALGPFRVATGFPGDISVSLWLASSDSLPSAAMDSLAATVQAAWNFCSQAFGRLPIREVAVASADVPTPRGFAGLVLLDRHTARLFASPDSAAGEIPRDATDAVFREVARTWWGNSVAAAGMGSGWIAESFPAWTPLAARGARDGDSVRRDMVRQVDAAWRAAAAGAGDLPLAALLPDGSHVDLLRTKGVAAIEAMRQALGEARFREALLSMTREHRNGWLTLDGVMAAVGPDVTTVLRSFLF